MKNRNRNIRILNNRRPGFGSAATRSARYINNRRGFRASGLSLLPLALRPGLLLSGMTPILILALGFVILGSVGLGLISTNNVSAASLTLTIPNSISLDISPENGATFKKSNPSTLSVKTDVSYGYTLSIKTKDTANSNNLINGASKLTSIASPMDETSFSTSSASNTWGYLPSKLAGIDNSNFQPGPTSEPTTLDTTNSSTEGTNYDFTLAAKVDNTIPTGSYTNTFVLTATSNEPPIPTTMQEFGDYCDKMDIEQSLTLKDTRDSNKYTITKLKDGKCWMTKNLEISDYNLTSADSDVASDFKLPVSSTSGFKDNNTANVYVDGVNGGYYTWYAATAGEGNSSKSSGDTSHSICPKGWKLPDILDYKYLTLSYDDSKSLMSSPANFIKANLYRNGALTKSGLSPEYEERGFYWSSTPYLDYSTFKTYQLTFTDYGVYTNMEFLGSGASGVELPGSISQLERTDGGSIRCISRNSDIGTLQNVSEWGNKVNQGQTVSAIDSRNNKRYTVARLNDGKLWMTQNLEISNITLNSTDSDVSSNFVLPASTSDGFSTSDVSSVKVYIQEGAYGGYYNYKAATAGTSPSSGDATQSICPKGWKLPSKTEFENLMSKQGDQNLTKKPAYFLDGGCKSCREAVSGQGYYWLSTAYDYQYAYEFQTLGDYGWSGPEVNYNFKFRGYNVRCVAR